MESKILTVEASSLEHRIRSALVKIFGKSLESCDAQTELRDHPEVSYDSMSALECVAAIEEEFDIVVDIVEDDVTYSFKSIAAILVLVQRKIADRETITADS